METPADQVVVLLEMAAETAAMQVVNPAVRVAAVALAVMLVMAAMAVMVLARPALWAIGIGADLALAVLAVAAVAARVAVLQIATGLVKHHSLEAGVAELAF